MILLDSHQIGELVDSLLPHLKSARITGGDINEKEITFGINQEKILVYCSHPELNLISLQEKEEKITPFPFSWVKQIEGYTIERIIQPKLDRIIKFECSQADQMGSLRERFVYLELTGRENNIIITDQENKIISSYRRVSKKDSSHRQIKPGIKYNFPPSLKLKSITNISDDAFQRLAKEDSQLPVIEFLANNFLTKQNIWREILFRLEIDCGRRVSSIEAGEFFKRIKEVLQKFSHNDKWSLCKGPNRTDLFHFIPKNSAFSIEKRANSPFECLNYLLTHGLEEIKTNQKKSQLEGRIESLENFFKRSKEQVKKELSKNKNWEKYKKIGDLILSFKGKLQRGMEEATLPNLYGEGELNVKLDPQKEPAQNADMYYKKSKRMKRSIPHLRKRLQKINSQLERMERLKADLQNELYKKVEEELSEEFQEEEERRTQERKPYQEYNADNWKIWVGKNAKDNDELTFHVSNPEDIWLHAEQVPGSHVIIPNRTNAEVPKKVLLKAAKLAALNSQAKHSTKVPVMHTKRKYVNKPKGSPPGLVTPRKYSTIIVSLKND